MAFFSNSTFKSVVAVIVVFVAAVGGVYLGRRMSDGPSSQTIVSAPDDDSAPSTGLVVGSTFPNFQIFDETSAPVTTGQLLRGKGGVVLFLELGCPPCKEMTEKWQAAINDGHSNDVPLYAITINHPLSIRPYRLKRNLTFPIYSDSLNYFMDSCRVENYPLQMVVGKSGTVQSFTFDSREELDFDDLRDQIGR